MTTFNPGRDGRYGRQRCGACTSNQLAPVLDLGWSPVADAYTDEPVTRETHPLRLVRCERCTLVQIEHVLPQELLFGTGYSFYSSASPPLSDYHARYAAHVISRDELTNKPGVVVEIGSNDGDFARHFVTSGYTVVGVDPADGPAEVAAERGVTTIVKPFTRKLAAELRDELGRVKLIIANHVLAHVADVAEIMSGIDELIADDGTAYVEVQYLPDLLLANAFDLVYHEHRSFFSLHALSRAALAWGLSVNTVTWTGRQGGSIRVTLSRSTESSSFARRLHQREAWLLEPGALSGLQGRVGLLRDRLRDQLRRLHDRDEVVAGYGAPAKATTLMNYCGIDSSDLKFISDTTVAKQNRYVPNTGVRIISPLEATDERVDVYLLFAWNYLGDILQREHEYTATGGRWLVPIPVPTII